MLAHINATYGGSQQQQQQQSETPRARPMTQTLTETRTETRTNTRPEPTPTSTPRRSSGASNITSVEAMENAFLRREQQLMELAIELQAKDEEFKLKVKAFENHLQEQQQQQQQRARQFEHDLDRRARAFDAELEARTIEISKREDEIAKREDEIAKRENAIAKGEREIARLRDELTTIERSNRAMPQRALAAVEELQRGLEMSSENTKRVMREQQEQIKKLAKAALGFEKDAQHAASVIATLQEELHALRGDLEIANSRAATPIMESLHGMMNDVHQAVVMTKRAAKEVRSRPTVGFVSAAVDRPVNRTVENATPESDSAASSDSEYMRPPPLEMTGRSERTIR